jgi:calcineurin-like phosphoesterase family protein
MIEIHEILDKEFNQIRHFFKTTTEPFNDLEWDGEELLVIYNGLKVETYTKKDLYEFGAFS